MKKQPGRNGGTLSTLTKGESLPGAGYPKGVPHSKTRLKKLLEIIIKKKNPLTGSEEMTAFEVIDIAIWNKAAKGDVNAYREILDRVEGKVSQPIEMEGQPLINTPIQINVLDTGQKIATSEEQIKLLEDGKE